IQILTPDETQGDFYESQIKPALHAGKIFGVSHGFSIHFKTIVPPKDVDVVMIAPKSPGHLLRRVYTEGRGVPSLLAIHQDASGRAHEYALCYAYGIGSTKAGVLQTTFNEETESDLFGEQAVLCGDLTRGEKVVGDGTRKAMKEILARIQDGSFAKEWVEENKKAGKNFAALCEKEKQHLIEQVGAKLRGMMSWLQRDTKKPGLAQKPEAKVVNA